MKSNLQFLKIIGCIAVFVAGTHLVLSTDLLGAGILERLLEMSGAFKDHCRYTLPMQG